MLLIILMNVLICPQKLQSSSLIDVEVAGSNRFSCLHETSRQHHRSKSLEMGCR